MTRPEALAVDRSYDLHGVGIGVTCGDAAALAAIDQRLHAFVCDAARAVRPELHFELRLRGEREPVSPPPGPGRPVYDTPYGQLFYFDDAGVLYGELAGVRLRCAAGHGSAVIEAGGYCGLELYLATHPLMTIALMELLERRGRYSIHAACLAHEGRGVLIAGPSGAGKSTLTLALATAGIAFLSDDVAFLTQEPDETVRALGFADALGMTPGSAERFPELRPMLEQPLTEGFPKRLVRIEDALPGVLVMAACTPRALIFPVVEPELPSAIVPLDPREAWLRLVPDVLLTEPEATQAHLAALAAMLGQVQTYTLRSGADLGRAAELVVEALAG